MAGVSSLQKLLRFAARSVQDDRRNAVLVISEGKYESFFKTPGETYAFLKFLSHATWDLILLVAGYMAQGSLACMSSKCMP